MLAALLRRVADLEKALARFANRNNWNSAEWHSREKPLAVWKGEQPWSEAQKALDKKDIT